MRTSNVWNRLSILLVTRGKPRKPVSRWLVAGPSGRLGDYLILALLYV